MKGQSDLFFELLSDSAITNLCGYINWSETKCQLEEQLNGDSEVLEEIKSKEKESLKGTCFSCKHLIRIECKPTK